MGIDYRFYRPSFFEVGYRTLLTVFLLKKNDRSLSFCAHGSQYAAHINMLLTNLSQIDTQNHTHTSMHVCGKLKNTHQLGSFFGIVNKMEASN